MSNYPKEDSFVDIQYRNKITRESIYIEWDAVASFNTIKEFEHWKNNHPNGDNVVSWKIIDGDNL
jgi:hypothetical protein